MKIVFMGTPLPAAETLGQLIKAKHEIAMVLTQPDRPKGRGRKLTSSPVKEIALKHGLALEQPEKLKGNQQIASLINTLKPEAIVVVAYGQLLPKEIIKLPKHGCLNVHASALPKYRGAAPIQWALLKGESSTGVTVMKIDEGLDTGDILAQAPVKIAETDNTISLSKKLFAQGSKLLLKVMKELERGKVKPVKQNEAAASNAPRLTKEAGEIDWRRSAKEIHNRIRALVPWPVAHTFFRGKLLKLWASQIHVLDLATKFNQPGSILGLVKDAGFIVATGQGHLLVTEVQLEGGKRLLAHVFVHGHDVEIGQTLPN